MTTPDFLKLVREAAASLKIDMEMLKRAAQCRLLRRREEADGDPADGDARAAALHPRRDRFRPRYRRPAIVADGVNALRAPDRAMLVITHYQRLLDYIMPDRVHVL